MLKNLEIQENKEQEKNEKVVNKELSNDEFEIPEDPVSINDPLEKFNRPMYSLNKGIDRVVIKPVTKTYEAITPNFIQKGVTNVLNYLNFIKCCLFLDFVRNGTKSW